MTEVIKQNGEVEPLQLEKLQSCVARVGGSYQLAQAVVADVVAGLPARITTSELYRRLFQRLRQEHPTYSLRLNLKQAIAALGPTGFPFEQFVAKVLERVGYQTKTNLVLPGKCVQHEIDVWAKAGESRGSTPDSHEFIFECKFHQQADKKSNIQAVLYSYARVLDLNEHEGWARYCPGLVTNTKLSLDAIHYGECHDMRLIAWGYPFDDSLERLVEKAKSYPITILIALTDSACAKLISQKVVLIQDLLALTESELRQQGGLTAAVAAQVRHEAELLLE